MPRIRREGIPEPLMAHLIRRVPQREISTSQLGMLARWLATDPEVPKGQWFKRFPEMIVCGEGALVKTFLRPGAGSCWGRGGVIAIKFAMASRRSRGDSPWSGLRLRQPPARCRLASQPCFFRSARGWFPDWLIARSTGLAMPPSSVSLGHSQGCRPQLCLPPRISPRRCAVGLMQKRDRAVFMSCFFACSPSFATEAADHRGGFRTRHRSSNRRKTCPA